MGSGPTNIGDLFQGKNTPSKDQTTTAPSTTLDPVAMVAKLRSAMDSDRGRDRDRPQKATVAPNNPPPPPRRRGHLVAAGASSRFPSWPDHRRGIANDMARSALFTVRQRQPRMHFKCANVATLNNLEILYTGEELRQRDEDVLLQLFHLARLSKLNEPVHFVAHAVLRQLGWTVNARSYSELAECIDRMLACSIHIVNHLPNEVMRTFAGSLVQSFEHEKNGISKIEKWAITFDPRILNLFGPMAYTQIDWRQRIVLPPLAKWLHTFYFTHRNPFPMKVETLKELSFATAKYLSAFRRQLEAALNELVKVGFLESWNIDATGKVAVVRAPAAPDPLSSPVDDDAVTTLTAA